MPTPIRLKPKSNDTLHHVTLSLNASRTAEPDNVLTTAASTTGITQLSVLIDPGLGAFTVRQSSRSLSAREWARVPLASYLRSRQFTT